jgi:hypothetical protein
MRSINHWLWTAGFVLQCLLVAALLVRGVARRFPVFVLLIAFYAARSALLFAIFGHVTAATYRTLYNGLSPVDIFLQLLVAGELGLHGMQKRGWTWRRAAFFPGLVVLAAAAAWSITTVLPERAPVPLDRGALFTSALMLLLFLWMTWAKASRLPYSIAAGFGSYSAVGLMAEVERSRVAVARNPRAYSAWSYVQAGVYLAVLLFWLLVLRDDQERRSAISFSTRPTAT